MKLKNLQSFTNFKGLYTKDESGLVPSDSSKGVYASEIQNVVCKDGTIRPVGGYVKEDNGTAVPTFASSTASYFTGGNSFTALDGTNRRLLFSDDGIAYVYWSNLNKYEILNDQSGTLDSAYQPSNVISLFFTNASAPERIQNLLFYSWSPEGPHFYWNCAQAQYASSTATTIVTTSSSLTRFYYLNPEVIPSAQRIVIMDGIEYTYTGVSGGTFTGVTPDPTAGGHTAGAGIFQKPVENPAEFTTALGDNPDIFFWYKGRLGVGSTNRSNVVLSESGTTTFLVGDGGGPVDFVYKGVGGYVAMNIGDGGGAMRGAGVLKDNFILWKRDAIIAGKITQDSPTTEYTRLSNIVNRSNIGIVHKSAFCSSENELYYISQDKEFKRIVQKDDGTDFPISETVLDDIDATMRGFEFDKCRLIHFEDSVYIACREGDDNDTVIEYDRLKNTYYIHRKPVAGWFIHGNQLYFTTPYDLMVYVWTKGEDGVFDDNDAAVATLWKSGRLKFGDMFDEKKVPVFVAYLRMNEITTVNFQIDFNYLGSLYTTNFDVSGDGTSNDSGAYIISTPITSSFGTNIYGIEPYGTRNQALNDEGMFDVVVFKTLPIKKRPHDVSLTISSNDVGQNYRIIEWAFAHKSNDVVAKKRIIE